MSTANKIQHGGDHYKKYGDFQPWDAVIAWKLGYLEGTALKYIARWRDKNGVEDIRKAIHFLEKLVEVETSNEKPKEVPRTDYFRNQLRGVGWDLDSPVSRSSNYSGDIRGAAMANYSPRTTGYARVNENKKLTLSQLAQQRSFGDYGNVLVSPTASALGGFRSVYPVDEQTGDSLPTDGLLNDTSGFDALHMRE